MPTNKWLRFIRPHAAALTISLVIIAILLAGERGPATIILWAAVAFLYHTWGFVSNNVCDYPNDVRDPKKKHFPTVSGEIPINTAIEITLFLTALWIYVGVSAAIGSQYPAETLLCFGGATAAGMFYNAYGKRTVFGNLGECLAFSLLIPFAYFAVAGPVLEPAIVLVFLYATITIFVQNWCEGDLKDVDVDPVTLLGQLGVRKLTAFDGKIYILHTPRSVHLLSEGSLLVAFACLLLMPIPWYYGVAAAALFGMGVRLHIMQFEVSDTTTMLRLAVAKTFLHGLALYVALAPLLGAPAMTLMFVFVVAWAVVFNKLSWGTTIEPKV